LQFADLARPLRGISPGSAKRRDENALMQNWAAAGALRKIPPPRFAHQTFVPTQSQDRRAIPPVAARARLPAGTRQWRRRIPENRVRAPKYDESRIGWASRTASLASRSAASTSPLRTSALENSCGPAQNRDSVSRQTGSERSRHRSLPARARPSPESCALWTLRCKAHNFLEIRAGGNQIALL